MIYSIVALPLFVHLLKTRHQLNPLVMFAVVAGLIILSEVLKKPFDKGFFGQGYEFLYYFAFFVSGFWMMTQGDRFWKTLGEFRFVFLVLGVMCFIINVQAPEMLRDIGYSHTEAQMYVLGGWVEGGMAFHSIPSLGLALAHSLNSFFWCMAIFGFAMVHLNKMHWMLPILSRLVYPFYIIHLPVMFFGFVFVVQTEVSWGLEFAMLNIATFAGTCLVVWTVDQMPKARPFFGLTAPLVPKRPIPIPQWEPGMKPQPA
jgi:surface polysaccharide O-acyltransferase-like enzyme